MSTNLLYIGDNFDNTVKTFDPVTGHFLGTFVLPGSGGLNGPRGILFNPLGNLLVSNQNVAKKKNVQYGNVLKYSGQTGKFQSELILSKDKEEFPFAPRGIVLSNNVLFVADFLDHKDMPGELRTYDGTTGDFLGNLDHSGFSGQFYPRGVVFGPDGLLYVSVRNIPSNLGGAVLRFHPTGGFIDVFVENSDVNNFNNFLHRPEGLVFGPDGNLYITSFRMDNTDTDKILIFDGVTGDFLDKIDLDVVGQARSFAQAILFGPDGKLFVPITGNGFDVGSVRRYNVQDKTFDYLVPPAIAERPLDEPWFLSFGNTDPATLAYQQ